MKKLNKILSVGLSLVMCAGMVVPALAATYNIGYGDVTIYKGGHKGYNDEGEVETHSWEDDEEVIITGKTDEYNVTVEDGTNANITLDGVNIDSSSTGKAAIGIGAGSNVTIELDGTNEVKSGDGKAGVSVGDGASLTINDKEGTDEGSLKATGGDGGAGIGGDKAADSGSITINGGTIEATGGTDGAGIGTGANGGHADKIEITGGDVTATGVKGAAGIGTGYTEGPAVTSSVGEININIGEGERVTAKNDRGEYDAGFAHGAGIGLGSVDGGSANIESINISTSSTGTVTATGGKYGGAGIGGGHTAYKGTAEVGSITISGSGTVNATGDIGTITVDGKVYPNGGGGAGIGSGYSIGGSNNVGAININITGAVNATGNSGAGIGSGSGSTAGSIDIKGGTVKAAGGAGIGSGFYGTVDTINITNSNVEAKASDGGAGIGSGKKGTVGGITITGSQSQVTADGGNQAAAIGAGLYGSFDAISITGGTIIATSGSNASAIGYGNVKGDSIENGIIAIQGVDSLVALGDKYFAIDTRANVEGVAQSILNGRFLENSKKPNQCPNGLTGSQDTTFIVVNAQGKTIKQFTLKNLSVYNMYESFAVSLPEGTYYVFSRDENKYGGSIASYQENPSKQIAYVISENDMLNADLMQFPSYDVSYKFASATEGKELPEEITNMKLGGSTGNKLTHEKFLEMVERGDSFEKVHTEDGGTWSFNAWTEMRPVTEDGQEIRDVELVGTWSFCGHEHKTTTNTEEPTCTEPGKSQTVCDDCHEVLSTGDVVSALDHDYGEWQEVTAATCTEDGLERQVCSRDESHVVERVIPAIDHDWDDGVITKQPTETEEGEITYTCQHDSSHTYTESIPRLVPDPDTEIEEPDVPLGEEPDDIEIEDPEVPLAGIFTRADAIGYLWEQTGSPDAELSDFPDVPEDHYWAVAIGWAQDMGIALPDEDGNFRPDDLVLRSSSEPEGELQQFLNRYAVFAGAAEQGETFIQLTGASDDIIMGEEAQVIFDEFFAKLEAALTRKAA